MGVVTNYLISMVTRQVDNHGIVIWFDPECYYKELAEQLELPKTTVLRYTDSFFALRHQAEPLINETEPPRMVVYIPLSETDTHHALVELESMGISMKPGHTAHSCNTRPSLIARYALKSLLGDETTAKIEKQIVEGKFTLAELDKLAEKGEGITSGAIALIFGTSNAQEIALAFLNSEQYDDSITNKDALPELATIFSETFGFELQERENLEAYRLRFVRYLLATDLITSLIGEIPSSLASVPIARPANAREACIALANNWRRRRDLATSYDEHATQVEQKLGLHSITFTAGQITKVQTFLAIEKKLQESIALALQASATDQLLAQAHDRQSIFWSEHQPEIQAIWALIVVSGQVLVEADRIEHALKNTTSAEELFSFYTANDHPWCLLDTYHRHMEQRYHEFNFSFTDGLEQLLTKARQRYMQVGSSLAESFLQHYQAGKFQLEGVLRQVEIFDKKVKPNLNEGKVAYVWVDALRYEMAHELAQSLSKDAASEIEAALGTVPTITPIGMASLLPGAQKSTSIVSTTNGNIALAINGSVIKDRKDRLKFLKSNVEGTVFDTKLDDLLPKPSKKVSEGIHNANLILITSQEIDLLGEGNNIAIARWTMDEVLRKLKQAFRILGQQGVKTIIFTADHGYLFADELSSDMKIDSPKGSVADLHRRAWVGQGGETSSSYLRAHISDFGIASDLDIAVPWGFACFKVKGGADAYFHGGMSPQELIVPVVTLKPKKEPSGMTNEISWSLSLSSKKISTRFCSVQIVGKGNSLFELTPPKVRVEVRRGQTCLSVPAGASYGFDELTGDVELKLRENDAQNIETNTLTLLITQTLAKATVSIHLLDSVSGIELASVNNVEMVITL